MDGAEYFGRRWALTLSVVKLAALNLYVRTVYQS